MTYRGIDEPETLYFNVYSYAEPRVPMGFTFERTTKTNWNKYLREN